MKKACALLLLLSLAAQACAQKPRPCEAKTYEFINGQWHGGRLTTKKPRTVDEITTRTGNSVNAQQL